MLADNQPNQWQVIASSHSPAQPTFGVGAASGADQAQGGQMPAMMGYADGGVVGQPPGLQQPGRAVSPAFANAQIMDALNRNPGMAQKIQQIVQQAVQSGAIDPQMAHQAVQMCQACLNNPALWPQLRQYAIKIGMCGPNDLPEQYDQGLVVLVLAAAKAVESGGGMQTEQQPPAFANGGMIHGPGTGTSDSVSAVNTSNGQPVKVSNGEFVIPADVVAAKGRDFFDALVRRYHGALPRDAK